MTDQQSPPPAPAPCLCRAYPSTQKGGTLIAEDVWDLATHEQRLEAPGAYRPARCPRCNAKVHIHDLRTRLLLGQPERCTEVVRFRCADRARCGAAWQVLPAFLARWLWRSWAVVESALDAPQRCVVAARTRRRWRARLDSDARTLVEVLRLGAGELARALVRATGLDARRIEVVAHYRSVIRPAPGAALAELAAWVHHLAPGIRVM